MLVYGKCECLDMQMLYVCALCASCGRSQCCLTSVSLCLPLPVAMSAFMICRGLCACTESDLVDTPATVLFSVCNAVTVG